MLNALTGDMKARTYGLCLSIPTHINTSKDNTVHHLLSMMQASLEAALLYARRLPPAWECVNSVYILLVTCALMICLICMPEGIHIRQIPCAHVTTITCNTFTPQIKDSSSGTLLMYHRTPFLKGYKFHRFYGFLRLPQNMYHQKLEILSWHWLMTEAKTTVFLSCRYHQEFIITKGKESI